MEGWKRYEYGHDELDAYESACGYMDEGKLVCVLVEEKAIRVCVYGMRDEDRAFLYAADAKERAALHASLAFHTI
jgi:hypothetical protein